MWVKFCAVWARVDSWNHQLGHGAPLQRLFVLLLHCHDHRPLLFPHLPLQPLGLTHLLVDAVALTVLRPLQMESYAMQMFDEVFDFPSRHCSFRHHLCCLLYKGFALLTWVVFHGHYRVRAGLTLPPKEDYLNGFQFEGLQANALNFWQIKT